MCYKCYCVNVLVCHKWYCLVCRASQLNIDHCVTSWKCFCVTVLSFYKCYCVQELLCYKCYCLVCRPSQLTIDHCLGDSLLPLTPFPLHLHCHLIQFCCCTYLSCEMQFYVLLVKSFPFNVTIGNICTGRAPVCQQFWRIQNACLQQLV